MLHGKLITCVALEQHFFFITTVYSSPSMCLLHFVEGIQTQFAAHINSKSTNIFLGDTNCNILNTFPTQ